jgi:hypothetical protein
MSAGISGALEILLISVLVTWLPAGLAAASVTFAVSTRWYTDQLISDYRYHTVMFWVLVATGWLLFAGVCVALRWDAQFRSQYAGLQLPCPRGYRKALRIRDDIAILRLTKEAREEA